MRCDCKECGGTGEVTCPECNGHGHVDGAIEDIRLERNLESYDELLELQKDAKRVIRQADVLKKLRPRHAASYEAQLDATLEVINAQARAVAERKQEATTSVF